MKVLLLNGSPHAKGCTFTALSEVADTLKQEGIETEIINLGKGAIRDCIRGGKTGFGGLANHAQFGEKYGVADEMYCAW